MHVREAAARPGEVELVGMYDPDPPVIQQNLERWAEYGLDIPVFDSVGRCCMNHISGMVLACCLFVSCFFLSDRIRVCPNGSFD